MRTAGISLGALALVLLIGGPWAMADWPWPSSGKDSAKPTAGKSKGSEPSTLSKLNTGTKNFFSGLFGGKKPDAKKKAATYTNPYFKKEPPKKASGLSSWFAPKETPVPRSTSEWMDLKPSRP